MSTRQQVIAAGIEYLHGIGSDHVCKICIKHEGSCCIGCRFLVDGVGCQQRNTGCTAWLCGFLRYIFHEAGLMQGWEQFWKQVPGKGYREDFTPASFDVQTWLEPIDIRYLSEAFAEDLQELLYSNHPFWVLELKDTLDRLMDQMEYDADEGSVKAARAEINYLMRHFRRFHAAKERLNNP